MLCACGTWGHDLQCWSWWACPVFLILWLYPGLYQSWKPPGMEIAHPAWVTSWWKSCSLHLEHLHSSSAHPSCPHSPESQALPSPQCPWRCCKAAPSPSPHLLLVAKYAQREKDTNICVCAPTTHLKLNSEKEIFLKKLPKGCISNSVTFPPGSLAHVSGDLPLLKLSSKNIYFVILLQSFHSLLSVPKRWCDPSISLAIRGLFSAVTSIQDRATADLILFNTIFVFFLIILFFFF